MPNVCIQLGMNCASPHFPLSLSLSPSIILPLPLLSCLALSPSMTVITDMRAEQSSLRLQRLLNMAG